MDIHRALSALFANQAAVQPLLGSLGFQFPDGGALGLSTSKLDSPLGIVPFDSAGLPTSTSSTLLTPTKKVKLEDELCSPVSSRSSTVSSSHFSSPQRSPTRKPSCPIPEEKKDNAYFERRRKNNDAAKRSRDARRQKEEAVATKAQALEQENIQLRGQITILQQEAAKLRFLLFSTNHSSSKPSPSISAESTSSDDSDSKNGSTIEV
uniref:BZIP domain-containing protein n=1 Tax=Caenorhabditis japonica TaxID=281687 RepID=A0A8R1HYB0_CAEJA